MGKFNLSNPCPCLYVIETVCKLFQKVYHSELENPLLLREPFQIQIIANAVAQPAFLSPEVSARGLFEGPTGGPDGLTPGWSLVLRGPAGLGGLRGLRGATDGTWTVAARIFFSTAAILR